MVTSVMLICSGIPSAQSTRTTEYNAQSKQMIVPAAKGSHVVVDGTFAKGEWDDAIRVAISDNCKLYLLADSENPYVGFKLLKAIGEAVSEVYITLNDKEFYNLHSSGALGEALGLENFTL